MSRSILKKSTPLKAVHPDIPEEVETPGDTSQSGISDQPRDQDTKNAEGETDTLPPTSLGTSESKKEDVSKKKKNKNLKVVDSIRVANDRLSTSPRSRFLKKRNKVKENVKENDTEFPFPGPKGGCPPPPIPAYHKSEYEGASSFPLPTLGKSESKEASPLSVIGAPDKSESIEASQLELIPTQDKSESIEANLLELMPTQGKLGSRKTSPLASKSSKDKSRPKKASQLSPISPKDQSQGIPSTKDRHVARSDSNTNSELTKAAEDITIQNQVNTNIENVFSDTSGGITESKNKADVTDSVMQDSLPNQERGIPLDDTSGECVQSKNVSDVTDSMMQDSQRDQESMNTSGATLGECDQSQIVADDFDIVMQDSLKDQESTNLSNVLPDDGACVECENVGNDPNSIMQESVQKQENTNTSGACVQSDKITDDILVTDLLLPGTSGETQDYAGLDIASLFPTSDEFCSSLQGSSRDQNEVLRNSVSAADNRGMGAKEVISDRCDRDDTVPATSLGESVDDEITSSVRNRCQRSSSPVSDMDCDEEESLV